MPAHCQVNKLHITFLDKVQAKIRGNPIVDIGGVPHVKMSERNACFYTSQPDFSEVHVSAFHILANALIDLERKGIPITGDNVRMSLIAELDERGTQDTVFVPKIRKVLGEKFFPEFFGTPRHYPLHVTPIDCILHKGRVCISDGNHRMRAILTMAEFYLPIAEVAHCSERNIRLWLANGDTLYDIRSTKQDFASRILGLGPSEQLVGFSAALQDYFIYGKPIPS